MIQLELTQKERDILVEVLEYDMSELHRELADTDNWKFKALLKEKDAVIRKVLEILERSKDEIQIRDDIYL